MTRYLDIRPEADLQEGRGKLVKNRHRTLPDDPHLVGSMRLDGRIVQLRGWVIELESSAHIKFEVHR